MFGAFHTGPALVIVRNLPLKLNFHLHISLKHSWPCELRYLCWRNPCYLGYYPALRPQRTQIVWPFVLSSINKASDSLLRFT